MFFKLIVVKIRDFLSQFVFLVTNLVEKPLQNLVKEVCLRGGGGLKRITKSLPLRYFLYMPLYNIFTFSTASNNDGKLYISTDDKPENKRLVCEITNYEYSQTIGEWFK